MAWPEITSLTELRPTFGTDIEYFTMCSQVHPAASVWSRLLISEVSLLPLIVDVFLKDLTLVFYPTGFMHVAWKNRCDRWDLQFAKLCNCSISACTFPFLVAFILHEILKTKNLTYRTWSNTALFLAYLFSMMLQLLADIRQINPRVVLSRLSRRLGRDEAECQDGEGTGEPTWHWEKWTGFSSRGAKLINCGFCNYLVCFVPFMFRKSNNLEGNNDK